MIGLSAITVRGETVNLKLEDCPEQVLNNVIARVAVENSDLLFENTVVRVDKERQIAEGDRVLSVDGSELGLVIYSKGFYMLDIDGKMKNLPSDGHIKIVKGNGKTRKKVTASEERTILTFKCFGSVVTLGSFLMGKSGFITLKGLQHQYRAVTPQDILFMTGYDKICYGEYYKGGRVVLKDGLPCIEADNKFIKLSELI